MPNDVWDEISQDIPSTSDPFLKQYLDGRANLISQEHTTRADASFRANLSPIAKRACAIVDRIRHDEKASVWTPAVEEDLARATNQPVFPGMMFMLAKERMEATRLWKIIRRMPKGALLHAHMDATVDFDFLLFQLLAAPGMHMSSDRSLDSDEALEDAGLSFRYRAKDVTQGSPWTNDYVPGTFLKITKVADDFPNGGRSGFLKWLKSRCVLSQEDSHNQHHGIDAIWAKFVKCFMVVGTMVHYEPIFRAFLQQLMKQLMADGVSWVELRYAPFKSFVSFVASVCRNRVLILTRCQLHMAS
jgi:adenosine deaminase CECR1